MPGYEDLIKEARLRIAPTVKERLAISRERSRLFDLEAEKDLKAQQLTPELLARKCTL